MAKERSAGAVIFFLEDKKPLFLLLHYAAGHWEFVKGHVKKGEGDLTTVVREAKEETEIKDLEFIEGFKESINYSYKREKQTIYEEATFYLAQTKTKKVTLSPEHVGYEWLNYKDSIARLTFKNAREVLKRAHKKMRGICIF